MQRPDANNLLAFLVAIVAIGALSAMDAVMKGLVLSLGTFDTMAWRAVVALLILTPLYLITKTEKPTRLALRYHFYRAALMLPMSILFFWGLGRVPLAQAIALTFIAPLIALILAGMVLKERVGPRTLTGSVLAFTGVAVIFFGQAQADLGHDAMMGSLAIMGSACCYAVNIIVMRQQAQNAKPLEIAFFQFLMTGVGFWFAAPFMGIPAAPDGQYGPLLLATLLSITGMLLLAWAYARAGAGYLSSTEYTGFLYAMFFGWLVFGEIPSLFTMTGAALIVGGCFVAARTRNIEHPTLESAG